MNNLIQSKVQKFEVKCDLAPPWMEKSIIAILFANNPKNEYPKRISKFNQLLAKSLHSYGMRLFYFWKAVCSAIWNCALQRTENLRGAVNICDRVGDIVEVLSVTWKKCPKIKPASYLDGLSLRLDLVAVGVDSLALLLGVEAQVLQEDDGPGGGVGAGGLHLGTNAVAQERHWPEKKEISCILRQAFKTQA